MGIDWIDFGEQVLLARRRLRLSQDELAQRLDLSRNYVSMIERGVTEPSYTIIARICAVLNISLPQSRNENQ